MPKGRIINRTVTYLAVTPDEYELPIYVADTIEELAEKFNTTPTTIRSSISKNKPGTTLGRKFVRVKNE